MPIGIAKGAALFMLQNTASMAFEGYSIMDAASTSASALYTVAQNNVPVIIVAAGAYALVQMYECTNREANIAAR